MPKNLDYLRALVGKVDQINSLYREDRKESLHPFDERSIHPNVSKVSLKLFDNGHYAQATFEAYKFIDKRVAKLSGSRSSGVKLMMDVFNENTPKISLNLLSNQSEIDEQQGYKFIFAGASSAIRNPRAHENTLPDTIDLCLDHLSFASMLLRTLDKRTNTTS